MTTVDGTWTLRYQAGFDASRRGDFETALTELCAALHLVCTSPARDWRFAEKLDELGLLFYQRGGYATSEQMQGLAVAEVLLAQGSESPDVAKYVARLRLAHAAQHREHETDAIARAPYRIVGEPYMILDDSLRSRVDWLLGEYLKREDQRAAAFVRGATARQQP